MKRFWKNQDGMTLIELLAAVAILSVVAITSVSLLLFCIRTDSFVLTGSSASVRSDQLNARLEGYFSAARTVATDVSPEPVAEEDCALRLTFDTSEGETSGTATCVLLWDASEQTLSLLQESIDTPVILGEKITDVSLELLPASESESQPVLIRLTYTVSGSYTCTKLFRIGN